MARNAQAPANASTTQSRPLNAFMAFRSYYNRMLPNMQQKERSGVLTTLWNADPYRNQWTIMAKVYSFLRTELGKDAVPLVAFLENACSILRIPSLDTYLEQQGFALLETATGQLRLIKFGEKSNPETECEQRNARSQKASKPENTSIATKTKNFQAFKEINKENIATAASGFIKQKKKETNAFKGNMRASSHSFGDENAAAGLYAEHELLQAVFASGLEFNPAHICDTTQQKYLVHKLYSKAYEMLIGGDFPVVHGTGFSRTIKHNPIAAAKELFSTEQAFEFDVLVVGEGDRPKHHLVCEVNPGERDKAYALDNPENMIAVLNGTVGPFSSTIEDNQRCSGTPHGDGYTLNSTPTYMQRMNYQDKTDGGQFHVFSSRPSSFVNGIASTCQFPHKNDISLDSRGSEECKGSRFPKGQEDHGNMVVTMDSEEMSWLQEIDALGCTESEYGNDARKVVSDINTAVVRNHPASHWIRNQGIHGKLSEEQGVDFLRDDFPDPDRHVYSGIFQPSDSILGKRYDGDNCGLSDRDTSHSKNEPPKKRSRMRDDFSFLLDALEQTEADVRDQIACRQEPAGYGSSMQDTSLNGSDSLIIGQTGGGNTRDDHFADFGFSMVMPDSTANVATTTTATTAATATTTADVDFFGATEPLSDTHGTSMDRLFDFDGEGSAEGRSFDLANMPLL